MLTQLASDVFAPLLVMVVLISSFVCGGLFLQLIFVVSTRGAAAERFYFNATFAVIVTLYAVALVDASTDTFPKAFSRVALFTALNVLLSGVVILGPTWSAYRLLHDFLGVRAFDRRKSSRNICMSARSLFIIGMSSVLSGLCYVALWKGFPVGTSSSGSDDGSSDQKLALLSFSELLLAKVAYSGVAGMGILGGYAAFSTPQAFLLPYLSRHGGEQAATMLQALNKRQRYLLNLWAQKKRQIAQLQHQAAQQEEGATVGGKSRAALISSWIAGAVARVGGGGQQTVDQLLSECEGIEKVSLSIFLQTQDVNQTISIAERGKSLASRIGAVVGVFLSIFATGKMILIAANVVVDVFLSASGAAMLKDGEGGANLPRVLSLLLSVIGNTSEGVNVVQGPVGLTRAAVFFNALTILISLRGFLLTVFRLTTSYASSVSSKSMIVVFTSCMGAYFIGQVLMLRLQLPSESHSVLVEMIGPLPRLRYQRVNDVCFLGSCVLSFLLHRYVLQRDRNSID